MRLESGHPSSLRYAIPQEHRWGKGVALSHCLDAVEDDRGLETELKILGSSSEGSIALLRISQFVIVIVIVRVIDSRSKASLGRTTELRSFADYE